MEGLKRKWNSRRGASILLALLFLLVCMMAGASILMAAASNAGKLHSNREEQQKYLTLSSALTLICDELEDVEYVGKYIYGQVQVMKFVPTGTDALGNQTWDWRPDYIRHYYWQEMGELRRETAPGAKEPWKLNDFLPLLNDLDIIFASGENFQVDPEIPGDKYKYEAFTTDQINALPKSPHIVTLKVNVDADVYKGLADEVTITAELNEKGEITLTAKLTANENFVMKAVLKPSGKPEDVITLSSNPAKKPSSVPEERGGEVALERTKGVENETVNKLTWTLDHIKKEAGG